MAVSGLDREGLVGIGSCCVDLVGTVDEGGTDAEFVVVTISAGVVDDKSDFLVLLGLEDDGELAESCKFPIRVVIDSLPVSQVECASLGCRDVFCGLDDLIVL